MWAWHDKVYYGAAHGLAGILCVLLQARDHLTRAELEEEVRPTLDYLVNTQLTSGNFPSSKGRICLKAFQMISNYNVSLRNNSGKVPTKSFIKESKVRSPG